MSIPPPPPPPPQPSQVERHNTPEVEDRSSKELLLNNILITRTEREAVLIEPSINSVRMSIRIKQADDTERILVRKFTSFLQQRAEQFIILRRKPVEGYDLSFLITHAHLERMVKARLVDFVIGFMEDVDKEVSAMKIAINARARVIAATWLEGLTARG
jgi:actin related protein 2/3 complex, subunit 4